MQHEITQAIPLLDEQGELTQPGWARRLLPVYDRSRVRGGPLRLKERDCCLVMNRQCALALTISDNRYMGMDSISLIDLWEGWQVTRSPMRLMPLGGTGLPQSSLRGSCARAGRGYGLGAAWVPGGGYASMRERGAPSTPIWTASGTGRRWTPRSCSPRSRRSPS